LKFFSSNNLLIWVVDSFQVWTAAAALEAPIFARASAGLTSLSLDKQSEWEGATQPTSYFVPVPEHMAAGDDNDHDNNQGSGGGGSVKPGPGSDTFSTPTELLELLGSTALFQLVHSTHEEVIHGRLPSSLLPIAPAPAAAAQQRDEQAAGEHITAAVIAALGEEVTGARVLVLKILSFTAASAHAAQAGPRYYAAKAQKNP
jgi:hypothetical protein